MTGSKAFVLRLGLGLVPASGDELLAELGDHLIAYEPRLWEQEGGFELSMTVVAADLWLAVLLAMAAVTTTGYPVVRLEARPVDRNS